MKEKTNIQYRESKPDKFTKAENNSRENKRRKREPKTKLFPQEN